jgi:hypothetical protein
MATERENLLARVYELSERLSWLGISPDIGDMSVTDLWGVYIFLRQKVEE